MSQRGGIKNCLTISVIVFEARNVWNARCVTGSGVGNSNEREIIDGTGGSTVGVVTTSFPIVFAEIKDTSFDMVFFFDKNDIIVFVRR